MSFVEDLRNYLLRLHQSDTSEPSGRSLVTLDPDWVRAELVQLFERLEREPPPSESDPFFLPLSLEDRFEMWTEDERAVHFANMLATLLQGSFLRGARREEIEQYVQLGMAIQLGLPEKPSSLARRLELKRLSNIAWSTKPPKSSFHENDWRSLPAYALEIRAVRRAANHVERTPIGNVLLSLTGRDALHWLLHVEAAQSTGPADDWRLSRETATHLLAHPHEVHADESWGYEIEFPHSWMTLRRLDALGVLKVIDGPYYRGYELLNEGKRALEALVSPNGSPFSVLADTLSQDEALAALDDKTGQSLAEASLNTSALATARQARLVVHEIRNALIPAQFALNSLYDSFVGAEVEATVARFRPRIDSGIERVLKFVNDLLKTSELATRPPEAFDLKRAVLDAQASLSTTLDIHVTGPDGLPTVLGFRDRFVFAVVNLLRNAEQAGASHVEVSMVLEEDGQNILLTVDDNGPGVPIENRERVFQRGISFRAGGAGEGLALVREVVEFELRGKVACLDKPDGGARFRMRLPVTERSQR